MLYLSELTLSHFRSHKKARLDSDGRPIALFGANGAGKTNILEAVSLFSPGRGMRRASAEDMIRRPEALGWKVKGVLRHGDTPYEIETWSENGSSRQLKIDGKTATQTALGQISRVVWLMPSMDRLWIEGADGRRRFLDRLTMSFFPEHADVSLQYEKAMRERNRLLKDQVRDAHWYRVLETNMSEAGSAIHANRVRALEILTLAQTQAETAFPVAELELQQSEGQMPQTSQDFLDALGESRFRDMAVGRTLVGPHRTDLYGTYAAKGVPAKDCSTGEQKALLVSLILSNARALSRDIGVAPLVLLDEVSAHLDANRRAALYDEICALKAQAWMTGTEADLFSDFAGRAQLFEVSEQDTLSEISHV